MSVINRYRCLDGEVPEELRLYWENLRIPSNELDFYKDIGVINRISILIFKEAFLECAHSDTRVKAQFQRAVVQIETKDAQVMEVGLHLFPIMRIKRDDLPLIEFYIKETDEKIDEDFEKIEKPSFELPYSMNRKLVKFLNEGLEYGDFTSLQFLNILNDVKQDATIDIYKKELFVEQNLNSGDSIALFKKSPSDKEPVQVAIYLGKGFYLFYGDLVCLRVASLEAMKTYYRASVVVKIFINKPPTDWELV